MALSRNNNTDPHGNCGNHGNCKPHSNCDNHGTHSPHHDRFFPHYDRLFRRIFATRESKIDLARNVLPSRCLENLRLESVHTEDTSFIDNELGEHFTDLLMCFEIKEKNILPESQNGDSCEQGRRRDHTPSRRNHTHKARLYLYLLVDHKSSPDKWAPLQLLRYVGNIYSKIFRDHRARNKNLPPEEKQPLPKKMPEVVPVVFYHGTEDWNYPLETMELIQPVSGAEEGRHIPRFQPLLYDLKLVENRKLLGSVQTVVGLISLKYLKQEFTKEIARLLAEEIRRLPPGSNLAKAIYTALAAVKEEREIEEFLALARQMRYTDIEEGVMTFAQAVRQKGREEGIHLGETLGKIKEKQEIVKRLLNRKFGLTETEAAEIAQIEDLQALDAALDEIIDAAEKRQVLEKLGM